MSEPSPGALAYGPDASALEELRRLRAFAECEIIPHSQALDAADAYPEAIVEGLRELGVVGFTIPRDFIVAAVLRFGTDEQRERLLPRLETGELEAARLLAVQAARCKDADSRSDVDTGMAKLHASEMCHEVVLDAMRIHRGNGYSKEYEIDRLHRDAPMPLLGESTSEIQRTNVARRSVERFREEHDGT